MSNPFDNASGLFFVLANKEEQRSIWPEFIHIPNGWRIEFGPAGKDSCNEFIISNWTDLRPKSLIKAMNKTVN